MDLGRKTYAQAVCKQLSIPEFMPEITTYKGEIAIRFTKDQIEKLASPFQYALVGKFSQGKPNLDTIKRFLEVQNYTEKYSVGVLDSKHILINFTGEKDFIRLYSRNQWYVTSKPMRILKWTPDFHVDIESSIVPLWILLPKLPAHLMKIEALRGIVSSFGKLLRVDASTASLKRPSTARIQIEFDLLKPFPRRFWIQQGDSSGFWQFIELENELPQYCVYCNHIGHTEAECWQKAPHRSQLSNEQVQQQGSGQGPRKNQDSDPPTQVWRQKQPETSNAEGSQQQQNITKPLQQDPQSSGNDMQANDTTDEQIMVEDTQMEMPFPNDIVSHSAPLHNQEAMDDNHEIQQKGIEDLREQSHVNSEKLNVENQSGLQNLQEQQYNQIHTPQTEEVQQSFPNPNDTLTANNIQQQKNIEQMTTNQVEAVASNGQEGREKIVEQLPAEAICIPKTQNLEAHAFIECNSASHESPNQSHPPSEVIEYSKGCPISNPFEALSISSAKKTPKSSGIDSLDSIQAELRYMSLDPKVDLGEYISDKFFEAKFTPAKKNTRARKPKKIFDI